MPSPAAAAVIPSEFGPHCITSTSDRSPEWTAPLFTVKSSTDRAVRSTSLIVRRYGWRCCLSTRSGEVVKVRLKEKKKELICVMTESCHSSVRCRQSYGRGSQIGDVHVFIRSASCFNRNNSLQIEAWYFEFKDFTISQRQSAGKCI